jgi:Outer membrane protein beta-barrel domain
MLKYIAASLAAALSLASLPAVSADNGVYVGASVGAGGVKFDGENFSYDAGSVGYKIVAGWRFLDWLSVEADYVDLGTGDDKVQGEKIETDVSGVSLSAVGFLAVGPVDVFARAGAIDWSADVTAPGLGIKGSDDGIDFTYGVGAQFRVWSLSLRAEYELFDITDADTVDLLSVGVTWTFL